MFTLSFIFLFIDYAVIIFLTVPWIIFLCKLMVLELKGLKTLMNILKVAEVGRNIKSATRNRKTNNWYSYCFDNPSPKEGRENL